MKLAAYLCLMSILLIQSTSSTAATYVVAIGNNLGAAGDVPLRYAESDARALLDVMQELAGVEPSQAILVKNGNAESVRKTLLETNLRIRQAQGRSSEKHLLLVYYSGHADQKGLHLGESSLPFDELRNIIESSPATARVLILDSCRSGGVTRVKGAKPAEVFSIQADNRMQAEGVAIITSSSAWEDSHESERLRGSFFTHHFLTALRGAADQDKDSTVTLNEAYSYSYRQTLRSSGRTRSLQHPTYSYDLKGKGDLPLTRLVGGASQRATLIFDEPGYYLIVKGQEGGELVHEVSTDRPKTALQVSPGAYFIQRRESRYYLEYQLQLQGRDNHRVKELDGKRIDYARLVRKGSVDTPIIHGLSAGLALRDGVAEGVDPGGHLLVEYSLDLPALTLQGRFRYHDTPFASVDGILTGDLKEFGVGIGLHRFWDLPSLSLGVGIVGDLGRVSQDFQTAGVAKPRESISLGVAALGTVQLALWEAFTVELETGPWIQFQKSSFTNAGAIVENTVTTSTLWWSALKLGVRL